MMFENIERDSGALFLNVYQSQRRAQTDMNELYIVGGLKSMLMETDSRELHTVFRFFTALVYRTTGMG